MNIDELTKSIEEAMTPAVAFALKIDQMEADAKESLADRRIMAGEEKRRWARDLLDVIGILKTTEKPELRELAALLAGWYWARLSGG